MRGRFSTLDPEALRQAIETEKLTQRAAAERFGVSLSAIERACKRLGLKTQRTGPRPGPDHPNWKGGRVLISRYWHVWTGPDHPMATKRGYVAEHRLVMAQQLGRVLASKEVVHHRNGDPQNNHPSNLEVFQTNADHLRHELAGRVPNWTPEGKERMREGVRAANTRRASRLDAPAPPKK